MNRLYRLILPVLLLALTACGRDDDEIITPDEIPTTEGAGAAALYAYVPADTAAVLGNLERMPDNVVDAWWAQIEPLMPLYRQMAENQEMPQAMRAYFDLLSRFDDRDSFETMGLRADALAVFYLDGLYPILRLEFGDRDALQATLETYSSEAGVPWHFGNIDDRQYRWLEFEEDKPGMPGLVLALNDDHLALAWMPRDEPRLQHLVGTRLPGDAFSTSDLQRLNRDYDYTPYGSGYFDLVRFTALLLDPEDTDARAARAAFGLEALADDPACHAEISALVSYFPRLVTGMPDIGADRVTMHGRLETAIALGEQLARITDVPLGLGADAGGLFNFGVGLNLVNARTTIRGYVDAWVDNPPQCPAFSDIADNAEDWQVQLNRPVPPVFTNIEGFRALVTDLQVEDDDWDIRGVAALSMSNPQLLMGMAAMFSPELAALDLQPDGQPRPVPPELFQGLLETEAWIAMSDAAVALAVGDNLEDELSAALRPGEVDGALLSYGVDYSTYTDLFGRVMDQVPDTHDSDTPEFRAMFDALGEIYDRNFFVIRLTSRGIDFESSATLSD